MSLPSKSIVSCFTNIMHYTVLCVLYSIKDSRFILKYHLRNRITNQVLHFTKLHHINFLKSDSDSCLEINNYLSKKNMNSYIKIDSVLKDPTHHDLITLVDKVTDDLDEIMMVTALLDLYNYTITKITYVSMVVCIFF